MTRPPHRFLVPVDQSEPAAEAVDVATRLARGVHGSVTLLAVVPLAVPASGSDGLVAMADPDEQQLLDRLAREHLEEVAADIGDGLDVRTAVSWGPAGSAIVDEVEDGGYDLVVVATRREGALGHLIHDHTVRQVLHQCSVPVLVVPATGTIDA